MSKKFPDDFDYYGGPNTKVRNEDDINCDVQRVKKWLKKQERETPNDYTAFIIASGDTIVFGYRTEECKVSMSVRVTTSWTMPIRSDSV